jgi:hypothetical protein
MIPRITLSPVRLWTALADSDVIAVHLETALDDSWSGELALEYFIWEHCSWLQLHFFNCYSGVPLGPLGTAATVPAPGNYDDGEIGEMMIGKSTRRKPAPVPLCPPQILHSARTRTRAAAVGSQRITARATARPQILTIVNLSGGLQRRRQAWLGIIKSWPDYISALTISTVVYRSFSNGRSVMWDMRFPRRWLWRLLSPEMWLHVVSYKLKMKVVGSFERLLTVYQTIPRKIPEGSMKPSLLN